MNPVALLLLSALTFTGAAHASSFKRVYLDSSYRVHVVTIKGRDIILASPGKPRTVNLSPDGETVAWDVDLGRLDDDGQSEGDSKLFIHRKGRTRVIACEPFIRGHWFWKGGRFVGIDCGGLHFAGRETLYDIETLKPVGTFYQGDIEMGKRPAWASE